MRAFSPSSIYSWSIGHILEHEFFCFGRLGSKGSKEKKCIWGFLSNFLGWFFQIFGVKTSFWKKFKTIIGIFLEPKNSAILISSLIMFQIAKSIFEQNPIYFLLYLLLLDLIGAHTAPYNKHSGHYDLQKMSPLKNPSETWN